MKYEVALDRARAVGAARANGLPLLAQTCSVLSLAHAVNPAMLYDGARKMGLSADKLVKLVAENVGEFAFVQFA